MSIKIMSQVWESGPEDRGELLVMLALADFADARGRCWPSIATIAKRSRMTTRSAQRILRRLQDCGAVKISTGTGRAGCNEYIITPDARVTPDTVSPLTPVSPPPDTCVTPPLTPVSPEPSLNHHEPSYRDTNVSLALSAPEPASSLAEAVSEYNATADQVGWPKVQKMTPARSKALRARLRDCGGVEGWRVAMHKGKASDFLCGRTSKPWTGCSFDWITKQANFTKLMEGNYDNRADNGSRPSGSGNGMVDAFAAVAAKRSSGHQGSGGDGSGSF